MSKPMERRDDRRFAADIDGMLTWDGISREVTIRNISCYGALLTGTVLPVVGTETTLIADHLEVCGDVIWRAGDRCGLLLRSEVDPYALLSDQSVDLVGHGLPQLTSPRIITRTTWV